MLRSSRGVVLAAGDEKMREYVDTCPKCHRRGLVDL